MKTWNEYKQHVRTIDSENNKLFDELEVQASIISTIIQQRKTLGMSQRDLASMCQMPQSSIARIESLQTTPNLSTLLKIIKPLGLKLTITK